jgi:hypothetical protein
MSASSHGTDRSPSEPGSGQWLGAPRKDNFSAKQTHSGNGVDQVLRDLRVYGWHASDIQQGRLRSSFGNSAQQSLHQLLGSTAIERSK